MANVTRGIAWAIVVLEALWATFWLITMIYVQASTDDTNHGMDYRYAIIINALHAVSPIALIGVMNEHHRYSPMAALFFVFAIMTDLWSLLDAVLHLNRTDNYDGVENLSKYSWLVFCAGGNYTKLVCTCRACIQGTAFRFCQGKGAAAAAAYQKYSLGFA